MPERSKNENYTRQAMAEDMEMKIDEAIRIASTIADELDNGVNPPELRDKWLGIAGELTGILTRLKQLAR